MSEIIKKPEGAELFHEGLWLRRSQVGGYAEYWNDIKGIWMVSASMSNAVIAIKLANDLTVLHANASGEAGMIIGNYIMPNATATAFTPNLKDNRPEALRVLDMCAKLQTDRGAEYDPKGAKERSFSRVAAAFNAITGKDITAAEVCLMQQILKDVRQWSNPNRLHKDSAIDGVNYNALKVEELCRQFGETL